MNENISTKRAMTDQQKKQVMDRMLALWLQAPHLRLGQLISNAISDVMPDPFYFEDFELLEKMGEYIEKVKPRAS